MITTSRVRIWRRPRSNTSSAYGPASVRYIEHPSDHPKGVFLHQTKPLARKRSPFRDAHKRAPRRHLRRLLNYRDEGWSRRATQEQLSCGLTKRNSPFCVSGQWWIAFFDQAGLVIRPAYSPSCDVGEQDDKKIAISKAGCRHRRRCIPAARRSFKTSSRNVPQPRRSSHEHLPALLGNHRAIA